jgi:dynein heavy chain
MGFAVLFQDVMDINVEFLRLEKIEVAGIQGKTLSLSVEKLYQEFLEDYKVFSEGSFDPLDTESTVRHECVFLSHTGH